MLRFVVLLLCLINAAYFAWAQGLLSAYGLGPTPQTEPQRLAQQIEPQALYLLPPEQATAAQASAEQAAIAAVAAAPLAPSALPTPAASAPAPAAPAPTAPVAQAAECWLAGPLPEAQINSLRPTLPAALGAQVQTLTTPARWIIYMGRYPNAQALLKKRNELSALNLQFEAIRNPALEPGLSLGAFPSQAQASEALTRLSQRGIRTARVLQEQAEGRAPALQFPALSAAQKTQLIAAYPPLDEPALWHRCN